MPHLLPEATVGVKENDLFTRVLLKGTKKGLMLGVRTRLTHGTKTTTKSRVPVIYFHKRIQVFDFNVSGALARVFLIFFPKSSTSLPRHFPFLIIPFWGPIATHVGLKS